MLGVLATPGSLGGMGISPDVLDGYEIEDIVYWWNQYEKSSNKVQQDIENAK